MYDQTPRNGALSKSLPDCTRSPRCNGTPARLLNPFDDGLLLLGGVMRPGSSPATAGLQRSHLNSPSEFQPISRRSQTVYRNVTSAANETVNHQRRFGGDHFWAEGVVEPAEPPIAKHRFLNLLLYDHHPVKIMLYFRLLVFLPLLLTLLLALLKGSDWRHNMYTFNLSEAPSLLRLPGGGGAHRNKTRTGGQLIKVPPSVLDTQFVITYDQMKTNLTEGLTASELTPVASRTLLSLTTIERYIESVDESGNGSSTIHELPIPYSYLLNPRRSEFCHSPNSTDYIAEKLQQVKPVERLRRDRSIKLALYDALYGPTFRDVDCRALRSFRKAGLLLSITIFFTMMLLIMEWLITLCHAVSKSFREGSVIAYAYVTQKTPSKIVTSTEPPALARPVGKPPALPHIRRGDIDTSTRQLTAACTSDPALVIPSDEWIQIEMPSHGNDSDVRRGAGMRDGSERSSSTPYSGRCPRVVPRRCQGHTGRIVVLGEHRLNVWADHLWWRPLGAVLSCLNIQLKRGDRRKYACVSLLEGPPTLFAIIALLLYSYALSFWKGNTADPACLNKFAELRPCPTGRCYILAVAVWWLLLINLVVHLFSVEICSCAERQFKANQEAADTCHVEVPKGERDACL